MKLDTTSYYPKSYLEEEEESELKDNIVTESERGPITESETEPITEPVHEPEPEHVREVPPTECERAIDSVSTFLSWVLVPLLMPVYGVMLAFGLSILNFTSLGTKLIYVAIVLAINVLLPAVTVLLLKKAGIVHDVGLNNREERSIPYLVCIICLVASGIFMHMKEAPIWLALFYYGGAATGIVELIVNKWWKISVHCAGIAGLVALLLRLYNGEYCLPETFIWLIVTVACAGLLGSARIWLGRHTLMQVLAGYAVGFCSVYFIMSC